MLLHIWKLLCSTVAFIHCPAKKRPSKNIVQEGSWPHSLGIWSYKHAVTSYPFAWLYPHPSIKSMFFWWGSVFLQVKPIWSFKKVQVYFAILQSAVPARAPTFPPCTVTYIHMTIYCKWYIMHISLILALEKYLYLHGRLLAVSSTCHNTLLCRKLTLNYLF